MTDRNDTEELFLPDDLRALDEELSSIRYEERPSFGPELRAELAHAWANQPKRRPAVFRYLAAAAIAGLLLTGASVPSARASLVAFLESFGETDTPEVVVTAPPAVAEAVRLAAVPSEQEPVLEIVAEPQPILVAPVEETVEVVAPLASALPQMLDRQRAEALLEDAYPAHLQRAGVGGVVGLRLWIDTNGLAGIANVAVSSNVRELDRAALQVAPLLRFVPARQGGTPVATWIDLPVTFEPDEDEIEPVVDFRGENPMRLPILDPDDVWEFEEPLELERLPEYTPETETAPALSTVEAELVDALGDPIVRRSLGPIESILSGIAPAGRDPIEWRASASAVLEEALERDLGNPTPLLALGRIRLRQGLRTDARMLFEQGLQMAVVAVSDASPEVVAELHYERGKLIREGWLASRDVGRVRASAFESAPCNEARASGRVQTGFASVERLMAWNYLCPAQLTQVFAAGFEPNHDAGETDLSLMMGSFRAAIDQQPGHVGANEAFLVALADDGRWQDVLYGARRFARHSGGHPKALLLAGLALQQQSSYTEAQAHFDAAIERLPQAEADAIQDVSVVLDAADVVQYRRLWGAERRAWENDFWETRDRTPGNAVNERRLEHLARSTFAMLRFGSVTSDAGEVWVRFGGPNRVHVVDEGAGKLTEFWDYGSRPDITFVRWVSSQTMDLTPEGRAYVDDLGKIFQP